jgi:hypothetical protein
LSFRTLERRDGNPASGMTITRTPVSSAKGSAVSVASAYTMPERVGIALVVISCVLYVLLIAVPFLPVDGKSKLVIGVSLAIVSEGTFWVGCLISGRQFMAYLRHKLWPGSWRRNPLS